jgi:hypothetical protein
MLPDYPERTKVRLHLLQLMPGCDPEPFGKLSERKEEPFRFENRIELADSEIQKSDAPT